MAFQVSYPITPGHAGHYKRVTPNGGVTLSTTSWTEYEVPAGAQGVIVIPVGLTGTMLFGKQSVVNAGDGADVADLDDEDLLELTAATAWQEAIDPLTADGFADVGVKATAGSSGKAIIQFLLGPNV